MIGDYTSSLYSKKCGSLILELKYSSLEVQYNPYSEDDACRLVKNRIGCTKKSEEEIGFNYTYSLRDGLLKLIKWRDAS